MSDSPGGDRTHQIRVHMASVESLGRRTRDLGDRETGRTGPSESDM